MGENLPFENIAVCSSGNEFEDKTIILDSINKQPVGFDVAFSVAEPVSGQRVVAVFFGKDFTHRKHVDNLVEQLHSHSAFHCDLIVPLKAVGHPYG